jgi:glucose-1-phosphate thymidylyltransferase
MKAIVLAAGYATRLYPLTLDRPKPLLEVGGHPILERLLAQLSDVDQLEHVYVVTNEKFVGHFRSFLAGRNGRPSVSVVDDGTSSDETKLGAIGDLDLVLRQEHVDDDLRVVAGVSIFSESPVAGFTRFALEKAAPATAVYDVGDPEAVKRYSVVATDDDGRVLSFEEKPEHPQSTLAGIAVYFYPRDMLPLVRTYVEEGNNADQPGRLVQWLYQRVPFYAWPVPGRWFDIGTKETLAEADREFSAEAL